MALKTYESLLNESTNLQILARIKNQEAEELKKQNIKSNGLVGWLGYHFESSSQLTEEFANFSRMIKSELKKTAGYELVSYNRGHFYFSAFLKNNKTNKLIYLSCDDVRGSDGWYNNLLIRTAQHNKDYTGGRNNFVKFTDIKTQADILTA